MVSHVNTFCRQSLYEKHNKRYVCVDFIASFMEHFTSSNQCNTFSPTNICKNVSNQATNDMVFQSGSLFKLVFKKNEKKSQNFFAF